MFSKHYVRACCVRLFHKARVRTRFKILDFLFYFLSFPFLFFSLLCFPLLSFSFPLLSFHLLCFAFLSFLCFAFISFPFLCVYFLFFTFFFHHIFRFVCSTVGKSQLSSCSLFLLMSSLPPNPSFRLTHDKAHCVIHFLFVVRSGPNTGVSNFFR